MKPENIDRANELCSKLQHLNQTNLSLEPFMSGESDDVVHLHAHIPHQRRALYIEGFPINAFAKWFDTLYTGERERLEKAISEL